MSPQGTDGGINQTAKENRMYKPNRSHSDGRPIRQVSVSISDLGQLVYVVCEDGTLWSIDKNVWAQLPVIPGDKQS